ncbi:MAG: hypothetical protein M3N29_07860 [Chloroflexota bacterium]|nr:hypothetical protein [Chloroflexota bacterium]
MELDPEGGRHAFPGADSWYLFADYLGWSWAYAMHLTSEGGTAPVSAVGTADQRPVRIAASFDEFVDLYISDSDVLYVAGAEGPVRTPRAD